MSEKNPPDSNFMTKLATFIVDKKTLFFLLYIFAVIFCAFSSGWVNVENDVTTYLPEDTETRQGIVAMNDNFTTFATAKIMVSNVTYETAEELSKQIEDVEGVSMVTFDDTPDHYTNASALFDISFDGVVSDEISKQALSDVEALMDGYDYCVYSDVGYDENATLQGEMSVILIIAVVIIIVVLICCCCGSGNALGGNSCGCGCGCGGGHDRTGTDPAGARRRLARKRNSKSNGQSYLGRTFNLYVPERFHHSDCLPDDAP